MNDHFFQRTRIKRACVGGSVHVVRRTLIFYPLECENLQALNSEVFSCSTSPQIIVYHLSSLKLDL